MYDPGTDPHARWRAIQTDPDPFVREMLERLRRAESVEPYHQVGDNWRRAPWEPNPYEHIGPGFVVARDMPAPDSDALTAKLRTTLPPGWMDLPPPPPSGAAATKRHRSMASPWAFVTTTSASMLAA